MAEAGATPTTAVGPTPVVPETAPPPPDGGGGGGVAARVSLDLARVNLGQSLLDRICAIVHAVDRSPLKLPGDDLGAVASAAGGVEDKLAVRREKIAGGHITQHMPHMGRRDELSAAIRFHDLGVRVSQPSVKSYEASTLTFWLRRPLRGPYV